ncbi:MAG: hypothetical protein JW932_14140 [Deltaproteobacteria bacterium]|nr:hypothetical protein [Deltaproteobacteria bacterium]
MTPYEQGRSPSKKNRYHKARENMVRTQLIPGQIHDSRVLQAMMEVARERFVPGPMKQNAYGGSALAIGNDQNRGTGWVDEISAPEWFSKRGNSLTRASRIIGYLSVRKTGYPRFPWVGD